MFHYALKRILLLIPTLLLISFLVFCIARMVPGNIVECGIVLRHILPNVVAPIIVMATMGLGNAILAESALSFLGFGVPPPAPSWGRMLSRDGLVYMLQAPWLAIFPGLPISLAVFGFNILRDALRDLLDPKRTGGSRGRAQ